jgi:hypothetical protein
LFPWSFYPLFKAKKYGFISTWASFVTALKIKRSVIDSLRSLPKVPLKISRYSASSIENINTGKKKLAHLLSLKARENTVYFQIIVIERLYNQAR